MMLQSVGGGQFLSAAPRIRPFLPVIVPIFTAMISSSAGSKSSPHLATESLHAQYFKFSANELRNQLAVRNLDTKGNKPQLVERLVNGVPRARKLTTRSPRDGIQRVQKLPTIPEIREMESIEKTEKLIRVPIAPDNEFARYHRHEVVPEVAAPIKHVIATVIPDFTEGGKNALADVLEDISVEVKDHKTQEQYAKEHGEGAGVHEVMPKEDSLLYIVRRFPVELVKDMVEDIVSTAEQYTKPEMEQERTKQQKEAKDEAPQELESSQRILLYTIGGLSAGWYFFGY